MYKGRVLFTQRLVAWAIRGKHRHGARNTGIIADLKPILAFDSVRVISSQGVLTRFWTSSGRLLWVVETTGGGLAFIKNNATDPTALSPLIISVTYHTEAELR